MEALRQEVERKRRQVHAPLEQHRPADRPANRYLSRAELGRDKPLADQEPHGAASTQKRKRDRHDAEDAASSTLATAAPPTLTASIAAAAAGRTRTTATAATSAVATIHTAAESAPAPPPHEVKLRLRALGEPIQLFGETDAARLERLSAASAASVAASATSAAAQLATDESLALKRGQLFNEALVYDVRTGTPKVQGMGALTMQGICAAHGIKVDADASVAPTTPEHTVARHFRQVLRLWETTLALRGEAEAASVAGRREAARFTECRRHLEPLFAQLQARTTPVELLSAFEEIVEHMRRREYVAAHDAYIRCAIGNAPWPMGVGVTGLHEGRGRQGVRDTKIAHVMNDETQRKYLQGVKRLLTFAQRVLPADAPSQMVG